jgi:hypothetical protein
MVENIRAVVFEWDDEAVMHRGAKGNIPNYGLLAGNIEKYAPHAAGPEIQGYKSVKYEAMIPVLIQAIKELKELIDAR